MRPVVPHLDRSVRRQHRIRQLMSSPSSTYYDLLSLFLSCALPEIKAAYKSLSLLYHPDKIGQRTSELLDATITFTALKLAYDTLLDSTSRASYETALAAVHVRAELRPTDLSTFRGAVVRLSELATEAVEPEDDRGGEAVADVAYTYPCRCGEVYEVLGSEIAMETWLGARVHFLLFEDLHCTSRYIDAS